MSGVLFRSDERGPLFELYFSKEKRRFKVRLAPEEEDWDYDDEADGQEMSRDIRDAKSYDEALEILGVI